MGTNYNINEFGEIVKNNIKNFPPEITFNANLQDGLNALGGKIIITPELLVFRPHALNFGDMSDRVFQIKDIVGYNKGFLTRFSVKLSNGMSIKFAVWQKQRIIDALEERRKALTF